MVSLTSDGKFFRPGAPLSRGALARALATLITIDPELYQREMSNQLKVLTGSVKVTRADCTVIEGRDLIELHPGDVVVTGAGSSPQIDFIEGSGLKIDENTEIKLKELVGRLYIKSDGDQGTAVEWLTFDLVKGKLFGALASTAQPPSESNSWPVLPGVTVSLYTGTSFDALYSSTVTDSLGAFSLPAAPGQYRLEMSKENYLTSSEIITVVGGEIQVYGNLVLQADSGEGTVEVTVENAVTGSPISGLTLNFRSGLGVETGDPVAVAATDENGAAELLLPGGYYTVEIGGNSLYAGDYWDLLSVGGQLMSWLVEINPSHADTTPPGEGTIRAAIGEDIIIKYLDAVDANGAPLAVYLLPETLLIP